MEDELIAQVLKLVSISSNISAEDSNVEKTSPVDAVVDGLLQLHAGDLSCMLKKSWRELVNADFKTGLSYAQISLDLIWEKLNTGNWKSVDRRWREAYTIGSLLKALCLIGMKVDMMEIFKCVDLGLMMGMPIMDNILAKIAKNIEETGVLSNDSRAPYEMNEYSGKFKASEQEEDKEARRGLKRKIFCDNKDRRDKKDLSKDQCEDDNACKENDSEEMELKTGSRVTSCITADMRLERSKIIQQITRPSLEYFNGSFVLLSKPVIIEKAMDHWPAMSNRRWGTDYLCKIAGHRTVPIEIGDRYTSEEWTQELLTINEFVEKFINCQNGKGYLAQHQLFDQIPDLRQDIYIPDYCCLGDNDSDDVIMNAWFGPSGTISPLHQDPYHNVFAQVVGKKYIRLYDRKYSEHLYPYDSHLLDNTSQVDVENPDLERFPLFAEVPYLECILNEGEMLYIPKKCWHYVRSLSLSFSVSFWWA